MAKLPACWLSHPNPRFQCFITLTKAPFSSKARSQSHRGRNPNPEEAFEKEQMQKIERENEKWKLRCGGGVSTLPPALPVACRKGKGQHLLKSSHIVEAIVEKACIRSDDVVLEIGPGTGNLTLRLLEIAKKVIAVEVDPRMVEELQRRVRQTEFADKLEVCYDLVLWAFAQRQTRMIVCGISCMCHL